MRRNRTVLLLALVLCVGCGYSSESLFDSRYKTIYVEMFDNHSRYRGFEVALTRALINEINAKTDMRVVGRDRADTVLTGQIADFHQQVLTEDEDDNIREAQVTIIVDMTWRNRRTGRPIRVVRGFKGTEQIKYDLGETLQTATGELFPYMAERLVERLEAAW